MKKFFVYVLLIVLIVATIMYRLRIYSGKGTARPLTSAVKTNFSADTSRNVVDPCDQSLWEHVYHSSRLQVLQHCITVTGVVENVKSEDDGDVHISLHLDAAQEHLLNAKNYSDQHGDLVLEAICAKKVSQQDAVGACSGFLNNVYIPVRGEKISATGTYVNDHEHGWNEIHPVTQIISGGIESISSADGNPIVGYTTKGQPIYHAPRGGKHYSSNGNKVYEKGK